MWREQKWKMENGILTSREIGSSRRTGLDYPEIIFSRYYPPDMLESINLRGQIRVRRLAFGATELAHVLKLIFAALPWYLKYLRYEVAGPTVGSGVKIVGSWASRSIVKLLIPTFEKNKIKKGIKKQRGADWKHRARLRPRREMNQINFTGLKFLLIINGSRRGGT